MNWSWLRRFSSDARWGRSTGNGDVLPGGYSLLGRYRRATASKFGLVNWCGFIGATASSLSLSFMCRKKTFVARGPSLPHPSPSVHCGIFTNAGQRWWWWWRGVGKEILHHGEKPIQADPGQSAACARTIQLNPTQCMLRSYLGKAKYTLSYQRRRLSGWNSQFLGGFFPANANTSITPRHSKLYKSKNWGDKEEK